MFGVGAFQDDAFQFDAFQLDPIEIPDDRERDPRYLRFLRAAIYQVEIRESELLLDARETEYAPALLRARVREDELVARRFELPDLERVALPAPEPAAVYEEPSRTVRVEAPLRQAVLEAQDRSAQNVIPQRTAVYLATPRSEVIAAPTRQAEFPVRAREPRFL